MTISIWVHFPSMSSAYRRSFNSTRAPRATHIRGQGRRLTILNAVWLADRIQSMSDFLKEPQWAMLVVTMSLKGCCGVMYGLFFPAKVLLRKAHSADAKPKRVHGPVALGYMKAEVNSMAISFSTSCSRFFSLVISKRMLSSVMHRFEMLLIGHTECSIL